MPEETMMLLRGEQGENGQLGWSGEKQEALLFSQQTMVVYKAEVLENKQGCSPLDQDWYPWSKNLIWFISVP